MTVKEVVDTLRDMDDAINVNYLVVFVFLVALAVFLLGVMVGSMGVYRYEHKPPVVETLHVDYPQDGPGLTPVPKNQDRGWAGSPGSLGVTFYE